MSRKIRPFFSPVRAAVGVALFTSRWIHVRSTDRGRLNPRDFLLLNVTTSDSPPPATAGNGFKGPARREYIIIRAGFALPRASRAGPRCVNRQFDTRQTGPEGAACRQKWKATSRNLCTSIEPVRYSRKKKKKKNSTAYRCLLWLINYACTCVYVCVCVCVCALIRDSWTLTCRANEI